MKEQETQKKLFTIKRFVCIGGGVALVLVAWALLIATSRNRVDPGTPELLKQGAEEGGADFCAWGQQPVSYRSLKAL